MSLGLEVRYPPHASAVVTKPNTLSHEYQTWLYGFLQEYFKCPDNLVNIENIPRELLDSECPYPELKDSLIQAYRTLSEKYQSRMQNIQEKLQITDR